MQFLHHDLGYLGGDEVVEVTLGSAANVRLMDATDFNNYLHGRPHQYIGGHARRSPMRVPVPHSGHWHVAVDLGGLAGRIRAGVRVLS